VKGREEAWDRIADKVWKKLQYWKKHNPKKYRQFFGEKLENWEKLLVRNFTSNSL
jgi:hypothetical protein